MRTWRVGTISMGAALLFLGIFLLLSQILHWDSAYILASWWPVLLIIIGGEILIYLLLSRQEKPYLKYDFLSIILVGIIGTVGIGFTVLQATGILDEVNIFLKSEVKTIDIPAYDEQVNDDVTRIVVETGNHPLTIESSTDNQVSIFGTYRAPDTKGEPSIKDSSDYLFTKVKGDTLYITFKDLPERNELVHSHMTTLQATLVVPSSKSLEVSGNYNQITLKPRMLGGSWNVTGTADLIVKLSKTDNLTVYAENVERISGDLSKWQFEDETVADRQNRESQEYVKEGNIKDFATLKLGTGEYPLTISNAVNVDVLIAN
ncbi:hypothetical protein GN156_13400 [bacterium LRH843]|nr:hypothetical protein [bacterium LRH843]